MYTYCLNNPVCNSDPTGEIGLMSILFAATGAAVNVFTSWLGATVTNQSYSLADAGVAAMTGALCSLGLGGAAAASFIGGLYSAVMSYQNGAEWWGVLITGFASGLCTFAGIGNFAGIEQTLANLGIQAFIDLIFCTGTNSMAAGVYAGVTNNVPGKDSISSTTDITPRPEPTTPTQTYTGGNGGIVRPDYPSSRFFRVCYTP